MRCYIQRHLPPISLPPTYLTYVSCLLTKHGVGYVPYALALISALPIVLVGTAFQDVFSAAEKAEKAALADGQDQSGKVIQAMHMRVFWID